MQKRATREFFTENTTPQIAKKLLGCMLVKKTKKETLAGIITETEAYTETDKASHTFGGKRTKKNNVMFKEGGFLYVYFTYGIHHCLNIVTEREGKGSAVLIRAVTPVKGIKTMMKNRRKNTQKGLTDGPGKICQAFNIDIQDNGIDLVDKKTIIYVTEQVKKPTKIIKTPRIGISKETEKKWRFVSV